MLNCLKNPNSFPEKLTEEKTIDTQQHSAPVNDYSKKGSRASSNNKKILGWEKTPSMKKIDYAVSVVFFVSIKVITQTQSIENIINDQTPV